MGAALTYARRYALFALVEITGEDDLDAPDLNAPEPLERRGREAAAEGARPREWQRKMVRPEGPTQ